MNELLVIGNPSRRRKRKKSHARRRKAVSRRRSRTVARRRRSTYRVRARRNPVSGFVGGIVPTVKNGAIGAVGGIANDVLYGFASSKLAMLPQAGIAKHAVKLLAALAIGKVGNMVMRGKGAALANGAATVVIHGALREQLLTMPTFQAGGFLPLGEYIEQDGMSGYDAAMPVDGFVDEPSEMGEYIEA